MKRLQLSVILIAILFFSACSTTKYPTGVWVNKEKIQGKSFNNIFIIVISDDLEA